jgi:drug/metabolite transporter (DMT)-like permease
LTASESSSLKGRLFIFAAAFLWGTSATLARFVFHRRQVPALTVVELRLLLAVLVLAPILAITRPASLRIARRDWGYFLILGLFGVAAVQGSYYYSISTLGVGLSILIQYLAPVLIVGFEMIRGARLQSRSLIAVLAAVAGTALVVGNVNPASVHASAMSWAIGFSSAFAFAFYIVMSKHGLKRYPPETVLLYTFGIAGLFWACVTPPWKIVAARYDASLWIMFSLLGMFSTLVPFALFYAGLRRLPPSEVAIVATLEPVIAVLTAAAFLSEGLALLQWFGAALVLVGAAISSMRVPESAPAQAERA